MSFLLKTFVKILYKLFKKYLITILTEWDSVKNVSLLKFTTFTNKKYSFDINYGFPVFCYSAMAIDSVGIFYQNNFSYSPSKMANLITQKYYPKEMWPMANVIVLVSSTMSFIIFSLQVLNCKLDKKHWMFLIKSKNHVKIIYQNFLLKSGCNLFCKFILTKQNILLQKQ